MTIVIQILLIAIAAISKAVADTIIFHGGGKLPKIAFFDNDVQGKRLPFTKYPLDGKHVFNSLMIVSFIASCAFGAWEYPVLQIALLGAAFILTFNLFWNKIFN